MNKLQDTKAGHFLNELADCWRQLPHKVLLAALVVPWVALYHFLGNSTLGYIDNQSLFAWMNYAYNSLEDDRHGKLIPLVVLVLLWIRRNQWLPVPKAPWWPALAVLGAGLLLHVVGYMVQQTRLSIAAFFLGFYGILGLAWGGKFLRAIFFPYILLVFAVPIGTMAEELTFPLRVLVTNISVAVSDVGLGIDVVKDGTRILGAQGFNYDVAPACSGIRSLTVLLAITTIYAFTGFKSAWKKLLIIAAAIPLAVLGNVIRITGVIIMAEAFGENAGLKFHDYAGFVTFALALGCLFLLGYWLKEEQPGRLLEPSV